MNICCWTTFFFGVVEWYFGVLVLWYYGFPASTIKPKHHITIVPHHHSTTSPKQIFMRIKTFTYLLCLFSFPMAVMSQSLGSQVFLRGGVSIGAPIVIKDIPEEASGKPGLGPNFNLLWRERFHSKFSLTLGIGYSEKGGSFTSPVTGKYDAARGIWGESFPFPVKIKYEGDVEGKIQNKYLDFPILASIHTEKWRFGLGYQYSKLLQGSLTGSIDVKALLLTFKDQPFDESDFIGTRENVALLSIERQFSDRISLSIDASASLNRLMTKEEDGLRNPRNVFIHFLVGYKLFDVSRGGYFAGR